MVESDEECRVVNIASSAGLNAVPRMAAYCGSKWAATGWSDSVRLELEQAGHKHVRVTTVCPTYINTGMFDGAKGILFTPMLKQEEVVADSWKAMLRGTPFVIVPWTSRLNKVVSGVLPVRARDVWLRRTGVYNSMAEFTGHTDK
jgi:short-subunit dehydrogenase